MRRFLTASIGVTAALALALAATATFPTRSLAAADFKPDDEGFIRNWLILAPIALPDGQTGADAIDKEQVPDEAKLKPKEGDKVSVGGKDLVWKKLEAGEYFFDINALLGAETENSAGYAVTYIVAEDELTGVKMLTGSDDQAKIYLNGKEVLKQAEARSQDKDQDTTEGLTLKKGVNVLVFKVVNEGGDWSGAVRFQDKDGKPLKDLAIRLTPE